MNKKKKAPELYKLYNNLLKKDSKAYSFYQERLSKIDMSKDSVPSEEQKGEPRVFFDLPILTEGISGKFHKKSFSLTEDSKCYVNSLETQDIGKRRDYKKRDQAIRSNINWNEVLWTCEKCGRKNSNQFSSCPRCGEKRKTTDEQIHAPKGGVTIKGKHFKGGEFIPSEGGYAEEYKKQQKEQSTEKQESVKQEKSAEKNNSQETFKKKYPHVSNVKVFKEGLAKEEAAEKALSLRKKNIFASKGSSSVHEKLNDYLNKRKPANIIDISGYSQNADEISKEQRMNQADFSDIQTVDEFVESEHPREEDGKFTEKGKGSSGKSKQASASYKPLSAKAERAKKAYVPATKERQAMADKMEYEVAKLIPKSQRTANNSPFDIIAGNIALEVKTMLVATNDRVHMRKDSRLRKEEFLRKNKKMRCGVLLIDKREKERIIVYFKEGVGAFRIGTMSKAEGTDLKTALSKLNLFGGN